MFSISLNSSQKLYARIRVRTLLAQNNVKKKNQATFGTAVTSGGSSLSKTLECTARELQGARNCRLGLPGAAEALKLAARAYLGTARGFEMAARAGFGPAK